MLASGVMSWSRNRMSLGEIFFYSISGGGCCLTLPSHTCRWFKDLSSRGSWVSTQEEIKN